MNTGTSVNSNLDSATTTSAASKMVSDNGKKKRSWSNLLVVGVIALPMVAAYVMFATGFGIPTGTINKGELLLPATSLKELDAKTLDGGEALDIDNRLLWRMVMVADNHCSEQCQQLLYLSRQVHIRLGEKSRRVERVYLLNQDQYSEELSGWLTEEHPKLVQATVSGEQWRKLMTPTNAADHGQDGSRLYVVDQQGFAMLSFDQSHDGADMLDDLKRLLRYSYEG